MTRVVVAMTRGANVAILEKELKSCVVKDQKDDSVTSCLPPIIFLNKI